MDARSLGLIYRWPMTGQRQAQPTYWNDHDADGEAICCGQARRQHDADGCTYRDPDGRNKCPCTVTYMELG